MLKQGWERSQFSPLGLEAVYFRGWGGQGLFEKTMHIIKLRERESKHRLKSICRIQYRRMLNISVCTVLIIIKWLTCQMLLQLITHKGWLHLRRFQNCNKINVKMGIFILNVEMWPVISFSTLCVISTYRNAPKLLYIWSIANWVKKNVKNSVHEKYIWNIIDGVIH